MTNISKSKTLTSEFQLLHQELIQAIAQLNKKSALYFFDELFTESERIMVIKRFSAFIMFDRGYSPYKVWNLLHISPSTASRLYLKYESGHCDNLLKLFTETKMPAFFSFMEKLIRAQGKDRWILLK